ncbi:MAG: Gfo/Idh/MocA family oxidoreductase [Candidatus Aenigmarchaeota archaeon]|nr:Gfo/Idh/MocA family oxidoreductase [Candidatus Aenigmarchaeota archaeon]
MGIIGYGRIASRFIPESKYVSGINIESVYGMNPHKLEEFSQKHELNSWHTNFDEFMETVDAVYVASPHLTHYEYVKKLLNNNKHVLCEKPIVLSKKEAEELFDLASKLNLILFEGIKTTYAPCFVQLIGLAKSGVIGNIKNVEGTFTKLVTDKSLREYNLQLGGGSITELASYPLSAIAKLLGNDYVNCNFTTYKDKETQVDLLTKINLIYPESMATAVVGIGCKQEGSLVVSGTKGYIYVPAPWWKTEYFEIRFEDPAKTRKVFTKFESDGLRYELSEFLISINNRHKSHKLTNKDSIFISEIIEKFRNNENTYTIRESNN